MKRTAEKVLSVISLVFTVLSVIGSFIFVAIMKTFTEGTLRTEIEMELYADPELTVEDVDMILSVLEYFEGFSWFIVVVLVISLIATIIGMIFMWNEKNPKLAGIMFIVAGLFAFILSPTSIMLYIAAILCFTRKPPLAAEDQSFIDNQYDDSMRPL
ncbi:DUF4064 domain-containing protein [Sporosarcina pasteurii]|uniref:DUF4064 domain-containing protein n=2 Tax=Sporosarcina pasteurii TaxID=1474 RepID=A0A380CGI1_SPOPA|nr:DUF4064 domain-containing protein [Sporosarcina pasteurii]MDS9472155.1 DUF4064 domain-containing protein [Sporosarcina pasteurii]SUJ20335.1 Uncharacterised protein [Sporosarcina pasteurii]